jgi:argininosuccinate lyase
MEHIPSLDNALAGLQSTLIFRAENDMEAIMPGYTHLQRAQPVLLSHWWLAHFWPLQKDRQRLADLRARTSIMPLGCGALAGTPFSIDRFALASDLDFDKPSPNSIEAVSDRDFVAEFLFCAALTGVHLSRLSEAIILFTSAEFSFLELSDAFSTGSSLMPQKKNPDVFELARGKSSTLTGHLAGFLGTLKGLPSAYDKDLQEDKEPVFKAYDTLTALLPVLSNALSTLTVHKDCLSAGLDAGLYATDLADYLVKKNIPFRDAHSLAGQAVHLAEQKGKALNQLTLNEYQSLDPVFERDVFLVFDPERSIARRTSYGGTARQAVLTQLSEAKAAL